MRLINVHDFSMKEFYGRSIPAYAILSHTWGDDEVLLSDMASDKQHKARAKGGFEKIASCCEQAKQDGWDWAWVDTCCIDKSSSAELSEAINSMYQWYLRAMVCYAHLVDVVWKGDYADADEDADGDEDQDESVLHAVKQSRWFKRGWTLQELIAPIEVEFFDKTWRFLGSKLTWASFLEETTRIPSMILRDSAAMHDIPVGLRMNWAFDRETTREEDMAYCLLGIFDINMPLLYGEGPKAFMRLQEEIMKHKDDHTLFLWDLPSESSQAEVGASGMSGGLLAGSPRNFHTSPHMYTRDLPPECPWPLVSNRGVQIRFYLKAVPQESWAQFGFKAPKPGEGGSVNASAPRSVQLAALRCRLGPMSMQKLLPVGPAADSSVIALVLWQPREAGSGVFYRKPGQYVKVSIGDVIGSWKLTSCFVLNVLHPMGQDLVYRGLSIRQGRCKTRLVASSAKGDWRRYLLATTHKKGLLYTVIWLRAIFTAHYLEGILQAGRLPAWPSDEATARRRFRERITPEAAREDVMITNIGPGPAARKVWVFEDESLELVLTLVNEFYEESSEGQDGVTISKLGSNLIATFREIRR